MVSDVGPSASDVNLAAAAAGATLRPLAGRDWRVRARDLEMSARETLEHIIEGLTFYSRDLATPVVEPPGNEELVLRCAPDTPIVGLIEGMEQCAAVLARVVAAVPEETRAFHPFGRADRSGFAAMACDEIVLHTDDIAAALRSTFEPPADLCERVLARLFPWAPAAGDAWDRLRWANGRLALPDHPRLGSDWRWHCAPLSEWDGTMPTAPR
jgi:hypothetical protein